MQKVDDKAAFEAQKIQANAESSAKARESTTMKNADIIAFAQKKLPNPLIL